MKICFERRLPGKGSLALIVSLLLTAGTLLSAEGTAEKGDSASASQKDMVVMAWQLDELMTFDPAEVYGDAEQESQT